MTGSDEPHPKTMRSYIIKNLILAVLCAIIFQRGRWKLVKV